MEWKHQKVKEQLKKLYQQHSKDGEARVKFRAEDFYEKFSDSEKAFSEWIGELEHPFEAIKRQVIKGLPEQFAKTSTLDKRKSPVGYTTDEDGEVFLEVQLLKQ